MAKPDRAETNRRNAAKSRGPRTDTGKARSALNRASHGLRSEATVIPGERAEDWQAFAEGIALDLGADGMAESAAATLIASNLWRLGRVARFEAAAAARAMSRSELIAIHARKALENPADVILGGASITAAKLTAIRDGLETVKAEAEWLAGCVELITDLDKYHGKTTMHVDFAVEVGNAAGTPPDWVKDVLTRGICTFSDIRKLLRFGTKNRQAVLAGFEERLTEKRTKVEFMEKQLAEFETRHEADLRALAETLCIPTEADMQRMQAFEAHVSRSLARSIEAFRALRELKREADPVRPRIAVASVAKKAVNRKNV